MVATAQRSAEENQLQVTESTRLSDLVRSAQANAEKVSADRDELAAQLDSLQEDAARSDAGVAAALGDIKNISADAGLTEMTGPGVVVTMTDAPRNADGKYPVDATPDDPEEFYDSALVGCAVLIDCHSMPSTTGAKDDRPRADIVIGGGGLAGLALALALQQRGLARLQALKLDGHLPATVRWPAP